MEFSDPVLMELPAGLFGGSSWDGHDTTRCGSSRVQLSVCLKGTQKWMACRPSKAISTMAGSTSLTKGVITATMDFNVRNHDRSARMPSTPALSLKLAQTG